MKRNVASLLAVVTAFALVLPHAPARGATPASGVVAPGKKVPIYRNTGRNAMRVTFEVQCDTSVAVPDRDDPNVTSFLSAVLHVPGNPQKAVIMNGDDSVETYVLQVGTGRSAVLEVYGEAKKGERGCAWTITKEEQLHGG